MDHVITPATARLFQAIKLHDLKGCQQALEDGADPNGYEREGFDRALAFSIAGQAPRDIPLLLLKYGANASPTEAKERYPLYAAANSGSCLTVCRALIERGADPDRITIDGSTPLHRAARKGHVEIVKYFVGVGARINRTSNDGLCALDFAVSTTKGEVEMLKIIEFLISKGASSSQLPAEPRPNHLTPFQRAVALNAGAAVTYFVDNCRENPAQSTLDGRSMLDLATGSSAKQALHMALTERAVAQGVNSTEQISATPSSLATFFPL
jgi:ankyrin repeat protein